ncbi:unnamed protein product [Acidithrix sp. C25]|nr:unnamed protein product [Acidithrix sp. C25]
MGIAPPLFFESPSNLKVRRSLILYFAAFEMFSSLGQLG